MCETASRDAVRQGLAVVLSGTVHGPAPVRCKDGFPSNVALVDDRQYEGLKSPRPNGRSLWWTWSIENNLSGANMDFDEFANAVGDDGVFRGF